MGEIERGAQVGLSLIGVPGQHRVDVAQTLVPVGNGGGLAEIGLVAQNDKQLLAVKAWLPDEKVNQQTTQPRHNQHTDREDQAQWSVDPGAERPQHKADHPGEHER